MPGCEKGCPNGCAFAHDQLRDMTLTWMQSHGKTRGYSELIMSSDCLVSKYPRAILGVFYQAPGNNNLGRQGYDSLNTDPAAAEAEARRTRRAYVAAYKLRLSDVPLFQLDLSRRADPFVLDDE